MVIHHWDFPSGNIFTKGISVRPRSEGLMGNFLQLCLGKGKSPFNGMANKTEKAEMTSEENFDPF